MTAMTRRRFLCTAAAAGGLGTLGSAARATEARWHGHAMGAHAEIRIRHLDVADAKPIFAEVESELLRLEGIFSLYRADSALARLNAQGRLAAPPPEMVEVLTLARGVHSATEGLFDPTVQPLFELYSEAAMAQLPVKPEPLTQRLATVDFSAVSVSSEAILLKSRGAALTLNGIAQGYLTDRIAALLRQRGLTEVLVDIGEVVARGAWSWKVGIAGRQGRISLQDHGLATSAPLGTVLDPATGVGHIMDPARGWVHAPQRQVSVIADTAALADALSTAAVLMPDVRIAALRARGFRVLTQPA